MLSCQGSFGDLERESLDSAEGLDKVLAADPDMANLAPKDATPSIPQEYELTSPHESSFADEMLPPSAREQVLEHNKNLDTDDILIPVIPPAQYQKSFVLSFLMIIFSEVGDKTFLIAAIMAMKHPRIVVFGAAFSSLVVMSVLSAALGQVVPTLIPKRYTNYIAAGLFLIFGSRMLMEGLRMQGGTESVKAEMEEVKHEIEEQGEVVELDAMEQGQGDKSHKVAVATNPNASSRIFEGAKNLGTLLFSPAFVQTFILTFLGEWGDRSQIATIALAAAQNVYWVTLGTVTGHALCTSVAVIGGRLLASKISVKTVTLGGSALFLAFAVVYFLEAMWHFQEYNVDDVLT